MKHECFEFIFCRNNMYDDNVACLLKARIVLSAETATEKLRLRATEEHVTSASAVTSRSSRRAAEGSIATWSGTSWTVPLQWNT
jgi:hypothetical protein